MEESANRAVSFISGSMLSISAAWINMDSITDFALKVFTVFVVGIVGGFAGLLGKKIFMWCEQKLMKD